MNVQQIANELSVTENDVISLVNVVYTSMIQDAAGETFLNMSEEDRADMVSAYILIEVKKFSEFCVTLLTNEEKRKAFELYVQSQVIYWSDAQ